MSKLQNIFRAFLFVFIFSFFLSPLSIFAQQSATTTRIINSSQPFTTVHVINEQFEDKAYSIGDTVDGSFVLKNTNSTDAPEIYYVLSILTGLNQKTLRASGQFGDTERQGPIFVAKQSDKQVDFSYNIPSFFNNTKTGEKTVLRVTAYSSSGVMTGWADKEINVTDTSKQLAQISKMGIEVNKEKFSPQQGPTIMTGQQGYFFFNIKNATTSTITVTPEITLYDRTAGASVVGTKTYDPIVIKSKTNSDQRLELPQLDNFKGVYAGKVRFVDSNGADVAESVYIRYIVGDVYATIQSVSVDKITGINKGDTLNTSVVYTGPATNINIPATVLGDGTMSVDITNKEGESVAKAVQNIPLDTNAENKTINLNLKATSEASEIFISVVIKKGNEVLASYSSRLTDPDKIVTPKGNGLALLISGTLGAIFIIILSLYFLKKNKRKSLMMFVLALAFVFGGAMIPTKSAQAFSIWYGINNPYDWQTVEVNSGFYSEAYAGSNVCLNAPSHIDMWLTFGGQQAYNGCDGPYDPDAHYFDNMSCAVGTYFTAPSVPGTYYVTLDVLGWNEGEYAGSAGGSTYVPINVVCPAGTVWNGGACAAPAASCTGPDGSTIASGSSKTYYTSSSASNCSAVAETRTCTNGTLSGSAQYASCVVNSCTLDGATVASGSSRLFYSSQSSSDCSGVSQSRTCTNGTLSGSATYQYSSCLTNSLVVQSIGATGVTITNPSGLGGVTNYTKTSGSNITNETLTAPVVNNYKFSFWSGCDSKNDTNRTCTVSITGGGTKTVTANYDTNACFQIVNHSSVTPTFVSNPSSMCTLKWNPTNDGTTNAGGICSPAGPIVCTLDGVPVASSNTSNTPNLTVGTHTLRCDDDYTHQTESVKCMVTPGFGEF